MIKTTTLPNKIRIITDSFDHADSVSLGVWVSVGARYETKDINGISHMLEHMAFKGTTSRSSYQISKEIEDVGGFINAYTGKNMTAYYVRVLKEHQEKGLDIIADILQNSVMDKEELAKEKGVIIQEINMQNDTPDDLVFDYFNEVAYPNQPLGRAILGTVDTVKQISSEQLLEYMHSQYTTSRIIVSASGAVNHEEFVNACIQKLTSFNNHKMPKAKKATYKGGEKRVVKSHEQVNLVLGFESAPYISDDYYTTKILASILGGGMSSRLFQEIREKRGLVYSIYAFNAAETDTGIFGVYAGTGEKEVKELMPVLCDELVKLPHSITEEEIERSKARLRANILMRLENISSHAEMNAIDTILFGKIIPKEEVIAKINAVQKTDLERVAGEIISKQPTLAALGPINEVLPFEKIIDRLK
ncbi:MAG: insulinase family protein [Alphaproteobacteria bacterium]|nr:insulinase family protein [Alphaproteobacteria bacterium]